MEIFYIIETELTQSLTVQMIETELIDSVTQSLTGRIKVRDELKLERCTLLCYELAPPFVGALALQKIQHATPQSLAAPHSDYKDLQER